MVRITPFDGTCSHKIKQVPINKNNLQIHDYNYDSASIDKMDEKCSCELCKTGRSMPGNISKEKSVKNLIAMKKRLKNRTLFVYAQNVFQ